MSSTKPSSEDLSPALFQPSRNTPQTSAGMTEEELKEAIRYQVEFYFSAQNLPTDTFLQSKMDEDQCVPLSLIASFGKIIALTTDQNIIIDALNDSKFIEISEDKTKLRLKDTRQRNTLILHNLPLETIDQDIKELFAKGNFFPEIKADLNQCWFISFENEQNAVAGLEFIRKQKIQDKNIRARLKPEAQLRTIYSQPVQLVQQGMYGYPAYPWNPLTQMYWDPNAENLNSKEGAYRGRNYKRGNRRDSNRRDGNKKRFNGQNRKNKRDYKKQPVLPLGPSDFPSLPCGTSKNTGYSKKFTKYSQNQLADALKKIEPQKPSALGDQFPVVVEAITSLEIDGAVPIDASDLPERTVPVPLSERVKNSPVAKPKLSGKPKIEKKAQASKPKQETKSTTWSQIVKAGEKKKDNAVQKATEPTSES
mmetsp:Transcript_126798/g.189172  ORF Transcript_126798/g.189172 Transcript_126798/m.189172 type:complete len:422 (-) Transcript_126798:100-1365(-)|eukprot:CAMPEP_0117031470 /NCGR_PEP_ID=MMETSP0472-20121206/22612_1 /TAXON_ID=693140 ORGANISM="Tiarina fusus, Strain LIS" /NCGR_SAMPLE_ID=MMETSP0472 /ASSEMBLY_ACC=CAM_ASM_000603 /LENGTH=421 /DNA_ID=CAMNT_0004739795 /DNA_START=87 /DNA_END=1352 /DNA_ORIENTATION=+